MFVRPTAMRPILEMVRAIARETDKHQLFTMFVRPSLAKLAQSMVGNTRRAGCGQPRAVRADTGI
jgi:hypothetical protein